MTSHAPHAAHGDNPDAVAHPAAPTPTAPPSAAPIAGAADSVTREELDKLPLQALLVRLGRLTMDQLAEVLHENVRTGRPVEEIVVAHGWVSREEIALLAAMKQGQAAGAAPEAPAPAVAPPPEPPAPHLTAVADDEPLILDPEPLAERMEPVPVVTIVEPEPFAPEPLEREEPVAAVETPELEPLAVAFQPEPEPEPEQPLPVADEAVDAPVAAPAAAETLAVVVVHLENGNRIWSSWFETVAEAQARAQDYADALVSTDAGRWPTIGGWTIRPETVVAVEVAVQVRGA